jgi:uncharacterized protein (TIGR04141 family)
MKLNIFSIPIDKVAALKEKLAQVNMAVIHSSEIGDWNTSFFFSKIPDPVEIPWINNYPTIFNDEEKPTNQIHYGAYLWEKDEVCFVLSFGKSHFYLRQFADSDFGLQMATRIANQDDVTQKAARKFVGTKKREVRSYAKETPIDIESGESVDYIQSSIISEHQDQLGKIGKFGTSLLLTLDIDPTGIPAIFDSLHTTMQQPQKFQLPKIEIIRDLGKIAEFDQRLLKQFHNIDSNASFSDETHHIVGIDFIFPSNQKYSFKINRHETQELESVDIFALKKFINQYSIGDDEILNIRVKIIPEDAKPHSKTLKQSLDFILDDERVMLADGEWKEFNEDYLTQLHLYIDGMIAIDTSLEDDFNEISIDEPTFNKNAESYGYTFADKDFKIIELPGHKIEAWDLKKNTTVYAVKFGPAQKLGYVCQQAIATLEVMRNKPDYRSKLGFDTYCLWLGITNVNQPDKLSDIGSIIFKQNLETWARKCLEMGIKPIVRISKKV